MNFDTYLETHRLNPRRAALLTAAAALALLGTTTLLAAGWIAGKMNIARVDPPTVEYVLLSLTLDEPAPPPPPPPPPGGLETEDKAEPEDDEIVEPEELEEPPSEIPPTIPAAKPQSGGDPAGQSGGIPGGKKSGIPGGNPIGIIGSRKPTIATRPSTRAPVVKKPLAALMARALYSPEPSSKLLAQTKAARFDKRDGKNTTSFCINAQGKVVDVATKSPFPGDPQVDRIIRETVKKWRFKPTKVGSKRVKTCTQRSFVIKFR